VGVIWRRWASGFVIALLVVALVMCVRSMWKVDVIEFNWEFVDSGAGREGLIGPGSTTLMSVRGQAGVLVMRSDKRRPATSSAPSGDTGDGSIRIDSYDARSGSWKWLDGRDWTNWTVAGVTMCNTKIVYNGGQLRGFMLPYWLVISGLSAALAWLVRSGRPERRTRRGLCPGCGYDVKGEFDKGCPECGWRRVPEVTATGAR
jgi:hypothetical protein